MERIPRRENKPSKRRKITAVQEVLEAPTILTPKEVNDIVVRIVEREGVGVRDDDMENSVATAQDLFFALTAVKDATTHRMEKEVKTANQQAKEAMEECNRLKEENRRMQVANEHYHKVAATLSQVTSYCTELEKENKYLKRKAKEASYTRVTEKGDSAIMEGEACYTRVGCDEVVQETTSQVEKAAHYTGAVYQEVVQEAANQTEGVAHFTGAVYQEVVQEAANQMVGEALCTGAVYQEVVQEAHYGGVILQEVVQETTNQMEGEAHYNGVVYEEVVQGTAVVESSYTSVVNQQMEQGNANQGQMEADASYKGVIVSSLTLGDGEWRQDVEIEVAGPSNLLENKLDGCDGITLHGDLEDSELRGHAEVRPKTIAAKGKTREKFQSKRSAPIDKNVKNADALFPKIPRPQRIQAKRNSRTLRGTEPLPITVPAHRKILLNEQDLKLVEFCEDVLCNIRRQHEAEDYFINIIKVTAGGATDHADGEARLVEIATTADSMGFELLHVMARRRVDNKGQFSIPTSRGIVFITVGKEAFIYTWEDPRDAAKCGSLRYMLRNSEVKLIGLNTRYGRNVLIVDGVVTEQDLQEGRLLDIQGLPRPELTDGNQRQNLTMPEANFDYALLYIGSIIGGGNICHALRSELNSQWNESIANKDQTRQSVHQTHIETNKDNCLIYYCKVSHGYLMVAHDHAVRTELVQHVLQGTKVFQCQPDARLIYDATRRNHSRSDEEVENDYRMSREVYVKLASETDKGKSTEEDIDRLLLNDNRMSWAQFTHYSVLLTHDSREGCYVAGTDVMDAVSGDDRDWNQWKTVGVEATAVSITTGGGNWTDGKSILLNYVINGSPLTSSLARKGSDIEVTTYNPDFEASVDAAAFQRMHSLAVHVCRKLKLDCKIKRSGTSKERLCQQTPFKGMEVAHCMAVTNLHQLSQGKEVTANGEAFDEQGIRANLHRLIQEATRGPAQELEETARTDIDTDTADEEGEFELPFKTMKTCIDICESSNGIQESKDNFWEGGDNSEGVIFGQDVNLALTNDD